MESQAPLKIRICGRELGGTRGEPDDYMDAGARATPGAVAALTYSQ